MTSPHDDDRIAHMIEACEQAADFVAGRTRAGLDDASSSRSSARQPRPCPRTRERTTRTLPWSIAARTRDRLTHHYFEVDLDGLWYTATESLPALRASFPAPLS